MRNLVKCVQKCVTHTTRTLCCENKKKDNRTHFSIYETAPFMRKETSEWKWIILCKSFTTQEGSIDEHSMLLKIIANSQQMVVSEWIKAVLFIITSGHWIFTWEIDVGYRKKNFFIAKMSHEKHIFLLVCNYWSIRGRQIISKAYYISQITHKYCTAYPNNR